MAILACRKNNATGTRDCNLLPIFLFIALISSSLILAVSCNSGNSLNKSNNRASSVASTKGSNKSAAINKKNVAIRKEVKNVNVNNEENTNISMKEKNKFNSQLAQIVINVPKQKVQRKSRRPTVEEFRLWQKIKALYESDDEESHKILGIVIDGLNPKYIATYRIWKILNSDSARSYVPADPLPSPLGNVEKIELLSNEPIGPQLSRIAESLKNLVIMDMAGMETLSNIPDRELKPEELIIKRALLCSNNPHFCPEIETIEQEASRKMDARGVLAAVGHDPTKRRARPNLEKLIEESQNDSGHDADSDDEEIEDPEAPNPTMMFSSPPDSDDDDDGDDTDGSDLDEQASPDEDDEEVDNQRKQQHHQANRSKTKKAGPHPKKTNPTKNHHHSHPKASNHHGPETPKNPESQQQEQAVPIQPIQRKSLVGSGLVSQDAPLGSEHLQRLDRLRNSEMFKRKMQVVRRGQV